MDNDNDTEIIVSDIRKMIVEVKLNLQSELITLEEDGKYGNNSYIKLNKIRNESIKQFDVIDFDFFYCRIINSQLLADINPLTVLNSILPDNYKTIQIETNYRLCSYKEMSKKKYIFFKFNSITLNMYFQSYSFTVDKIIFYINSKFVERETKETNKEKEEYKLEVVFPLDYIDETKYSIKIVYYIIFGEDTEIREKTIYLSLTDIERQSSRLLNSEITIKDSFFCMLTTQIYTCYILDETIINLIYENKIKYILFDKDVVEKDKNVFMTQINKKENKPYDITALTLSLNNKDTFYKK